MTVPLPAGASFVPADPPGPALVTFDFDGTLAEHSGGWGLLYRLFGVEAAGEARTDAYWSGDLPYRAWVEGNVSDLRERGVRREHLRRARAAVKLVAGVPELLGALRSAGIPFGVVSAGVGDLARRVAPFDPAFVVANEVVYDGDGVPVDAVPRVPPDAKGEVIARLCADAGVAPDRVVHVGDGESDLTAFETAGTAVLFDPTEAFEADAADAVDVTVHKRDLAELRPLVLDGATGRTPDDTG